MADRAQVAEIVAACEDYWTRAGLPAAAVAEMRYELHAHLDQAAAAGKSPEAVVGANLPAFAEAWAREQSPGGALPSWAEVAKAEERGRRRGVLISAGVMLVAVLAVLLALNVDTEGDSMDDMWMWVWLGTAVVFALGEIVTAGFFLLPFAAGAAVAFVLALITIPVGVQWAAFLIVSIAAVFALRQFGVHELEGDVASVGATRYVGQSAVVLEEVNRVTASGRVKMETEEWRATTSGPPILPGTEVVVTGITGTRLIVESAAQGSGL